MGNSIPLKATISRVNSNMDCDHIYLRIYDGVNGNELVDMKMSLENYALLATGLSHVMGEGEILVDNSKLGKVKYIKRLKVTISGSFFNSELLKNEINEWYLCGPINDFWWDYNLSDFMNFKNYKVDKGFTYVFVNVVKYIDDTSEEVALAEESFEELQSYYNTAVFSMEKFQ
jgi:hypothetical protein